MYILFIDDDKNVLTSINRSLKNWFRDEGITAIMVTSAKDAIRELKSYSKEIGVIVSDQRMPDLNGNELISIIQNKYPDIVPIILSGHSDLKDMEKMIKSQIFSFIGKPWQNIELQEEIKKAMNHFLIKKENRELKEKIKRELHLARDFQKTIMDNAIKKDLPITINVTYQPCISTGVSGDYYDIFKLSETKIVVLLGDVSGHGIQPAFISMALKSIIPFEYFKNIQTDSFSTIKFTQWLNNRLYDYLKPYPGLFVTLTCLYIDLDNKLCTCTNSGQPRPIILNNNSVSIIENNNIVLGIEKDNSYTNETIEIKPSSKIFICSDGIYPSGNSSEIYTEDDLINILQENINDLSNHTKILKSIYDRHLTEEIDDDITILTIEIDK
ncbi:MAG: fused response regulator/phosphatase [Spirochaetaceae bacterium]